MGEGCLKVLHYIECADVTFRVPWVDLMKELGGKGVAQVLLCRPGGNAEQCARANGIEVVTWKPLVSNFPPANLRYPWSLRSARPDVVNTRLSTAANIAGFWGKRLGVPTVAMLDNIHYKVKYYKKADHFTSCCELAKTNMVNQGIDPQIIDVVYNSVDVAKYRRDEAARLEFRKRLSVSPDDKLFIGLGSFTNMKGFDMLIDAFAAICREEGRVKLALAGDGPERASYLKQIADLGIEGRVVISDGYVDDVRPWLWSADFFALPSRGEGFPLITLEAMAAGLPVIATNVGGVCELITDGIEGLIVPAGDAAATAGAMRKMLGMDEAALSLMKGNVRTRIQRFTVQKHADLLMSIYEKVIANYRTSRCKPPCLAS
jgi:glycosyltransferase involved in cell wall biosynthesis